MVGIISKLPLKGMVSVWDIQIIARYDHAITDDERIRLGLTTRKTYLEIFEGETVSVNAHLAVLAHIRCNLDAHAEYIKCLRADKFNEVLEIIMKGI